MVQEDSRPDAAPTLASLRRRGAPRRPSQSRSSPGQPSQEQPDLFASLFDPILEVPSPTPFPFPVAQSPVYPLPVPEVSTPVDHLAALTPPATVIESFAERGALPPALASQAESRAEPALQTWTVSGLVRHVRGLVERGYGQVTVEGEISNWRPAGSGHCYFTVKDAGAQLSAVLFRRQASLLRFRPSDGDAVRLHGQLSVYESRGQMQLIIEWMEQVGFGALLAEVQRLKERLRREGLFDRKRPLPPFPTCIGVITSLQGAALRDIIKVCRRRHAAVQLLIYPAAVQGPNCPAEIAAGLRWFSAHPERAEVVLVARGGGDWEDLHGFDDEGVARAIAACALPVITGIGHAPDSTVADAAADVCAPTPSAAAELLTAAHHRVEERIARLHGRLLRAGSFNLLRAQGRFARLGAATVLRRVEDSLNRRSQRLDELTFRAEGAERLRVRQTELRHGSATTRLSRQNPLQRLRDDHRRLERLQGGLEQTSVLRLANAARRVENAQNRLTALSPLRVLERGYALVYGPDDQLLRDAATVPVSTEIRTRLARGELRARVLPPATAASSQREAPPRV